MFGSVKMAKRISSKAPSLPVEPSGGELSEYSASGTPRMQKNMPYRFEHILSIATSLSVLKSGDSSFLSFRTTSVHSVAKAPAKTFAENIKDQKMTLVTGSSDD